jgi:hypothetical protein
LGRILGGPAGATARALGAYGDVGLAAAQRETTLDAMNRAAGVTRARIGYGIGGFEANSMAKSYGVMGNRFMAMAQQNAGEAQWRAMRNLSTQYAGQTAALGVFAGAFTAGPKPMHVDGMSGMGMLDTYGYSNSGGGSAFSVNDASGQFGWAGVGFAQQVASASDKLRKMGNRNAQVYQLSHNNMGHIAERGLRGPGRMFSYTPQP